MQPYLHCGGHSMNLDLKYQVIIHNNDWPLAQEWCEQNIGEFNHTWYKLGIDPVDSLFNKQVESVWYFRYEEDATLFALRWA